VKVMDYQLADLKASAGLQVVANPTTTELLESNSRYFLEGASWH
jgi:hypothetical protein